jgi:hypothetical protein
MADFPRRRFLKASAGTLSGLALGSCGVEQRVETPAASGLDRPTLEALGRIVLPRKALGDVGVTRVIGDFLTWLEGFEPASERDHPYDSGEITYGPPDPAPLWRSQLDALNIVASKRFNAGFAAISESRQRLTLERQLPDNLPQDMPYAGNATHVGIGLIAWFYATPEANDLALQAKVGKYSCRGLQAGPDKPVPLAV